MSKEGGFAKYVDSILEQFIASVALQSTAESKMPYPSHWINRSNTEWYVYGSGEKNSIFTHEIISATLFLKIMAKVLSFYSSYGGEK